MSNNLTKRVGRILSGSANSIVDALEGMAPEMVMEQAIREVDQAIDDVRAELGRVISTKHLATSRLVEENRKHEELSEKIQLAIQEDREELAGAAISKQLDIEAQIPILEDSITQGKDAEEELTRYIQALEGRRREMETELKQFQASAGENVAANLPAGEADRAKGNNIEDAVRTAESVFERVMTSAGGVASGNKTDRDVAQKLVELDDMARNNRISERIAKYKSEKNE
ncbi:MAG: PspA/IM30 family protein [Hyphomicrobiales bacterium]|nr:PspA/IM30 family protein [Hyphomicrobiales bacterium]